MINSLIETGKNVVIVMIPVLLDVFLPQYSAAEQLTHYEIVKVQLMIILLALAIIGQAVIIFKNIFKKGKPPTTPTPGDLMGG